MFEIAGVGILWAFLAGIVSFLSPCVLPLVPGYVSYIAGRSAGEAAGPGVSSARLATLIPSLGFVLGFSLVFVALGASATALGQLFRSYRGEADLIAGSIIALFGLHLTGVLRLPLFNRDFRFTGVRLPMDGFGPVVLGAAFAFGWTPCIGPILGGILMLSAATATVSDGILLLSVYSLGLAIPFLTVATFTDVLMRRLRNLRRAGHYLQIISGAVLVAVGLAMAAGVLTSIGTWMLITFPSLQYLVV
jgi:cytochrome c-type biogenesis protein